MYIQILSCGPSCTIQDLGRFGFRRFGVSTAGAMDRIALATANALVGNPSGCAVIELTQAAAAFRLEGTDALVALAGAEAELSVGGSIVLRGQSALARAGADIRVGPARGGIFSCLAIGGGISTPPIMHSRSFHRRTAIGGTELRPGDRLPLGASALRVPQRLPGNLALAPKVGSIRVIAGPQADLFTKDAFDRLCSQSFAVHVRSDRMAYRLTGPALTHANGYNIVSDGVLPGSIQVPGDGQPLVLMRDCQTTGGYPKIATVISADLDRLAQMRPGAMVFFRPVGMDEAVAAARRMRSVIEDLPMRPRPATAGPGSEELLSNNLVSGVIDGSEDPTFS